ncbi:MAG: winged helix-turn-helix domain-containing protein [Beijerinckiaceae bacterium]|nr:winged helix-turn-helix domain-containing protein [Beijerinckiaceae bacterium]
MIDRAFSFGPYELYPDRALLLHDGERVALGSRALSILSLLVERAGELVSTSEIIDRVWPGIFVEESNLRVQMASLRKAIDDVRAATPLIVNEPGRGYRFCAAVVTSAQGHGPTAPPVTAPKPLQPPLLINPLIGREEAIKSIIGHISARRLITLTGPGGIGKTSLALAVLATLKREGKTPICFIDLTTLRDPSRVASALAVSLQLPVANEPLTPLLDFLHDREMLIVFDNCEHVIVGAASVVEALLMRCAAISILTTSREALRSPGEVLYKVEPLTVPPPGSGLSRSQAIAFPAVQLFSERAASVDGNFRLTDGNAGSVAHICQQLDGLPLALELAAGSIGSLGLDALVAGLDNRLSLLTQGSRTVRRHETLRAMMDWSFDLLSDQQRLVLACLSVFRAAFSLDAAVNVLETASLSKPEIIQAIQHLSGKSLLVAEHSQNMFTYRMLVTTRNYAAEILSASDHQSSVLKRHAAYVLKCLAEARIEWKTQSFADWWTKHSRLMDDVRAALDWAFSPEGGERIGVELTIASGPLWLGRSLLGEYFGHVRQALGGLARYDAIGSREELLLQISLGHLLFAAEGASSSEIAVFQRVIELARKLADLPSQITALWALAGAQGVTGDHRAAFATTEQMIALTADIDDEESSLIATRMHALSHRLKGDFTEARRLGESLIAADVSPDTSIGHIYRYDRTTAARANLACVLWIQGYADRALIMIKETVDAALERRNPHSLAYILSSVACPLAFWCGDNDLAAYFIELLMQHSKANAFTYMSERAAHYAMICEAGAGLGRPLTADTLRGFRKLAVFDREVLITIVPSLIDEATATRAQTAETSWSTAEMLRAGGEKLLAFDRDQHAGTAEGLFQRAIDVARQQEAFAWELRAATSLARLKLDQGTSSGGLDLLNTTLDRLVEGSETADVRIARALQSQLRGARRSVSS